jgi:hypothetical protein
VREFRLVEVLSSPGGSDNERVSSRFDQEVLNKSKLIECNCRWLSERVDPSNCLLVVTACRGSSLECIAGEDTNRAPGWTSGSGFTGWLVSH